MSFRILRSCPAFAFVCCLVLTVAFLGLPAVHAQPPGSQGCGVLDYNTPFILYSQPCAGGGNLRVKQGGLETWLSEGEWPRLSPDGRWIAFLKPDALYGDLWVYDLQTDTAQEIAPNDDTIVGYDWTADSTQIVVDYACGIYRIDRDGSNDVVLIENWPNAWQDCYNDAPDLAPADNRIAWHNDYYGIGVANADGSNPHWVPNTAAGDYTPHWSPDGQWLGFWRDDDTYWKIRPAGTDLTQLGFAPGDDAVNWAMWSSDGAWIVASAEVGGEQAVYALSAERPGIVLPMFYGADAYDYFVGAAGVLPFEVQYRLLPVMRRG